jgi:hypothetical protein
MNNDLNALKEVTLKLQKQKWLRKLITLKFISSQSANYLNKKTQTTYEVCNNISKHKHLQKNLPLTSTILAQVTYKINQVNIQL